MRPFRGFENHRKDYGVDSARKREPQQGFEQKRDLMGFIYIYIFFK